MSKFDFLNNEKYNFLKNDPHLGKNIILLGYGGSHSYGTNVPTSDVDIRGIAKNTTDCILGIDTFDQQEDKETDTVVYGLSKALNLLASCNPNIIELLGLRKQDYAIISPEGQLLLDNADMFLSKKAISSFGGYATAQLRRLQNALAHDSYPQKEKNRHILGSIQNAMHTFNDRYSEAYRKLTVRLNDKNELVADVVMHGYPLDELHGMLSEITSIIREYNKLNHRNKKKDDAHLNKHAMHLIRLLITGEEILRTGTVQTYREKEHDLLMDIRNGKYQKEDHDFIPAFYDMLNEYESKFEYAAKHTALPDKPDMVRIQNFLKEINLQTILAEKNTTN